MTKDQQIAALREALEDLRAFVGVMLGRGPNAVIPETVDTPIGVPVKVEAIIRAADAALLDPAPSEAVPVAVAWIIEDEGNRAVDYYPHVVAHIPVGTQLYAAPPAPSPERVSVTEADVSWLEDSAAYFERAHGAHCGERIAALRRIRAALAAKGRGVMDDETPHLVRCEDMTERERYWYRRTVFWREKALTLKHYPEAEQEIAAEIKALGKKKP